MQNTAFSKAYISRTRNAEFSNGAEINCNMFLMSEVLPLIKDKMAGPKVSFIVRYHCKPAILCMYGSTVEPLNKDTFGTSRFLSFIERLSSFRGDFL